MNTKLRRSVLFFSVVFVLVATAIAATLSDQGRSSTRAHDQASQSSAFASPKRSPISDRSQHGGPRGLLWSSCMHCPVSTAA
jgi:hypothetical protein